MSAPYPWLETAWQHVVTAARADKLGHAYLVTGPADCGKLALARALCAWLLCEQRSGDERCGNCRSCDILDSGFHPDLRTVQPEEDKRNIAIDQVRELIEFFALTPHYGTRRLALIQPAESMTTAAANALLKILEEPPPGAVLLLVSHRQGRLPATIRSRCQKLAVLPPPRAAVDAWLAAETADLSPSVDVTAHSHSGGPLSIHARLAAGVPAPFDQAVEVLHGLLHGAIDPLDGAQTFRDADFARLVDDIELVVRALLHFVAGSEPGHVRTSPASRRRLQETANKLNCKPLFLFLDHVGDARRILNRSSGVRGVEIIENLFLAWAALARTEKTA